MLALTILSGFLALCLLATVAGFGWFVLESNRDRAREQRDAFDRETAQAERHQHIVRSLAEQHEREQTEARAQLADVLATARHERDVLLDRIQRPEAMADPIPFTGEASDEPLTISQDDDEAQWAALAES